MNRTLLSGIAIVALAAALAPSLAAADTVNLRYGWPAGLGATVTFAGERTRYLGEQSRKSTATGRYRLKTRAAGDGLVVEYSDFVFEPGAGAATSDVQRDLVALMTRAGAALPDIRLGAGGAIEAFVGTDAMLAEFRAGFSRLGGRLPPDVHSRIEQALARILSKEVVEARMRENWNRDVGAWIGANLERGERYAMAASAPAPALGNAEVPMTVTFEYLGPAPCTAGSPPRCASLRMHSTVDSEKVGAAVKALVERLAAGGRQVPDIRDLRIDTSVEITSDPATLLPYTVDVTRSTGMTLHQDGQDRRTRQSQHQTYRYNYD